MLIGVISDTHGLLRPEALTALAGVEHILHAGDVGDIGILAALRGIAPVTAIRGNIDTRARARSCRRRRWWSWVGRLFYLVHAIEDLDISPKAAGVDVVVYGHSHRSAVERRGEVLYLNPGSAGPRRFQLPVTLALVTVDGDGVRARVLELVTE